MNDVMIIIDDTHKKKGMEKIIDNRSFGAMPFGGKYRLIDFILSNICFSGIKNVGIFIKGDSSSLINHLHAGKEWGLLRNKDGLFILPSCLKGVDEEPFANIKNVFDNIDYLERSKEEYVLLCSSNVIFNMDLSLIKEHFIKNDCDATIIYSEEIKPITNKFIHLEIDTDNKVIDYKFIKDIEDKKYNRNMDMFFLKKSLLMDLIEEGKENNEKTLLIDYILEKQNKLKVSAFKYNGYVAFIDDYLSYYKYNKDLLNFSIYNQLFLGRNEIITTRSDEAPTKYMKDSKVKNSLITEGCIIEGDVENSIIFRGVKIKRGSKVKNSIIMHKTIIGEGSVVENGILDKDVLVRENSFIKGEEKKPKIIKKKTVF